MALSVIQKTCHRRDCCLDSIDIQFPKLARGPFRPRNAMKDKRLSTLDVAGSIPVSRFSITSLQPDQFLPSPLVSEPNGSTRHSTGTPAPPNIAMKSFDGIAHFTVAGPARSE